LGVIVEVENFEVVSALIVVVVVVEVDVALFVAAH
jgi:hypothetical protein